MLIHPAAPRRTVLLASSIASGACFRGAARYARSRGWNLVTDMMYTGVFPRGWRGDGVIAVAAYQPDLIHRIRESGAPCVALATTGEELPFPSISSDDTRIGALAAGHLLERAYRSFAWAPFVDDRLDRERLAGFARGLAQHRHSLDLLPPAHRRVGGYWHDDWAGYRRSLLAGLRKLPRPAAVFAANDCVAAQLIDACREIGLEVPGEIAVIGVGNDPVICESTAVPLTSVDPGVEEMAYQAAAALDEIMHGNPVPQVTRVVPAGVITRMSTDTCAVGDSRVAQALAFIAEHFQDPMLTVGGVADAVGMSRRHLERSFSAETGSTVYEHILKRRMLEASRLLRTHPRTKVATIAAMVGLDGAGSFFRAFRRYFGESPTEHRRQDPRAGLAVGAVHESVAETESCDVCAVAAS